MLLLDADGTKIVERILEGDWSHLSEWDQPPRVIKQIIQVELKPDLSDSRPNVRWDFPGKDISELKGKHQGKVAIFFNGRSLASHDLTQIKCPIIGMNRTHHGHPTYFGPQPDYLCIVDTNWLNKKSVQEHPGLINGSNDPRPYGYRVPKSQRMRPFSFDLKRDGALAVTTGMLALQVAAYLGFTDIYCLGLDLHGLHFDETKSGNNMLAQERLCVEAAPLLKQRGINVWVCGSDHSWCKAFPAAPFSQLVGAS